jgi:hypothetical protein
MPRVRAVLVHEGRTVGHRGRGDLMRGQDLDVYARVVLERTLRAVRYRDATVAEMERMRQAYAHLHGDTPALCLQRRREI